MHTAHAPDAGEEAVLAVAVVIIVFFNRSGAHRPLHSFPTRRSSDLDLLSATVDAEAHSAELAERLNRTLSPSESAVRSEEHTSELQSRFDLVCRLLLEKKK